MSNVETEKTDFELAIERETGETIESIRKMPIEERRRKLEKKFGRKMRFLPSHGFIGRGSILHDRTITHEEVEKELDKALGK